MDNINVPKKVIRHVLKAINSLTQERQQKHIQEKDIVIRVKFGMRNLVPVKDVDYVIRMALFKLQRMGILMKKNGAFGIKRALDELGGPEVSKNIVNPDGEKPCCSNTIEEHHAAQDYGTHNGQSSSTSLAPHPSLIAVATGSETLIENCESEPGSSVQQPLVVSSSSNVPSGTETPVKDYKAPPGSK